MPAVKKVNKEDIVNACIRIVEKDGIQELNARRIAKELKCSTQPIFYIYSNMEEIKSDVLKEVSKIFYNNIYERNYDIPVYKDVGKNYIKFAKNKPVLFKMLFNTEPNETVLSFLNLTGSLEKIRETISKQTGLSNEDAQKFHIRMCLYVNGIASLIVNNICDFSEDEIELLIREHYISQILLEIQKGKVKKEVLDNMLKHNLQKKQ